MRLSKVSKLRYNDTIASLNYHRSVVARMMLQLLRSLKSYNLTMKLHKKRVNWQISNSRFETRFDPPFCVSNFRRVQYYWDFTFYSNITKIFCNKKSQTCHVYFKSIFFKYAFHKFQLSNVFSHYLLIQMWLICLQIFNDMCFNFLSFFLNLS